MIDDFFLSLISAVKDDVLKKFPPDEEALKYFRETKITGKGWSSDLYKYLVDKKKGGKENLAVEYFLSFARRYPRTISFLVENKEWTKENLFNFILYLDELNKRKL